MGTCGTFLARPPRLDRDIRRLATANAERELDRLVRAIMDGVYPPLGLRTKMKELETRKAEPEA